MSDMPEREAAREPVEEWTKLYVYAREQRKALRPPLPKAVLAAVIIGAVLLLVVGGLYLNRHFETLEAKRQAKATEQAIALVTAAAQTSEAQAATATAQVIELDRKAAATAAAQETIVAQQSINLQGTATAQALAQAATATKQAIDLRATAVAQGCAASDRYSLHVEEPTLFPKPGRMYVIGAPPFAVRATWEVTNTGECAWEEVRVRPLGGGEAIPVLEGERVEPGQVVEITVEFAFSGGGDVDMVRDVEGEWILVVLNPLGGDHVLFEQPHLTLRVEGWVIAATPTPTPTPTPTSTPTSTPMPTLTLTPKPTSTPTTTPTDTPRPPIDTPTPTAIWPATETPLPLPTATWPPTETPLPSPTATWPPTETPLPSPTATWPPP